MRQRMKRIVTLFFVATWLLLFGYFILNIALAFFPASEPDPGNLMGTVDVSRRVAAPDQSKIALLVRAHYFDLNLQLYILDNQHAADVPTDFNSMLWSSKDYDPAALVNFHEDVEWSTDSSVIAVAMEGQYVFAYDFQSGQAFEDPERIQSLLESRSHLQD